MSQIENNIYNRNFIYTCPDKVLFDNSLNINELKIYMIVRSFMDTTGNAYPSNNWIADKIGINRRNTICTINKLVKKGYLERVGIDGRRFLRIRVSPFPEPVDESLLVSPATPPSVASDTPPSVASDTLLYQSNINTKDIKTNVRLDKKQSDTTSNAIFENEEKVSPWNKPTFEREFDEQGKELNAYDLDFEEFWKLYPKKTNKKGAYWVWCDKKLFKIKEIILEKLKEQVAKDSSWEQGYAPHPRNYLQNERWEDEIQIKTKLQSNKKPVYDNNSTDWIHKKPFGVFL